MKFKLFDYLNLAVDVDKNFSDEKEFFDKYSSYLSEYPSTKQYMVINNCFDIIKANIVIKALINKQKIESASSLLNDYQFSSKSLEAIHARLPFIQWEKKKIFVPIFSPAINDRYETKLDQLSEEPFINLRTAKGTDQFFNDPFLTYKTAIFDSSFSNLLKVKTYKDLTVFYSYSFSQIYVITNQGTLDCLIPLFDRDLVCPNRINIPERVIKVMENYFNFNRTGFINSLVEEGFISQKLYNTIIRKQFE